MLSDASCVQVKKWIFPNTSPPVPSLLFRPPLEKPRSLPAAQHSRISTAQKLPGQLNSFDDRRNAEVVQAVHSIMSAGGPHKQFKY